MKRATLLEHSRLMLDRVLEMLIEGRASAEYCAYRAGKLKAIIGNDKVTTKVTNY